LRLAPRRAPLKNGGGTKKGGGMAAVDSGLAIPGRRLRLQGWTLFSFLALAFLAIELTLAMRLDWSQPEDVRWLMGMNWRLAAPYFLLTFTASPLQRLFPGRVTRWLLANRRYLGLAFAVAAFCQLVPIATLALRFRPVLADIHSASSQFGEDCIFLTLVLMTVTSFRAPGRLIGRVVWQRLHSAGIYLLAGLYAVSYVYFALYDTTATYVVLGAAFVLAWALRAAVWWRRRAEFGGRRFIWALAGLTNGTMLASWSWFGIETPARLGTVLAIASTLACTMFLGSLAAAPLERLRPGPATTWLAAQRDRFFVAFAFALGWYLAFALAGRVTVAPAPLPALPLPLAVAIAAATITLGMLLVLGRDRRAGREGFARLRPVAHAALAGLLAVGLVLGRGSG
jgi:hypothetical protein